MTNTTAPKSKAAKKVLVVEDEGEMGLLLSMMLNEKKFRIGLCEQSCISR